MIEIWYVVWALLGLNSEVATPPHFMSGPYPSVEECVTAGEATDYPPEGIAAAAANPGFEITIGCVQIKTEPDPEPVDHSKDVTT